MVIGYVNLSVCYRYVAYVVCMD